MKIARLVLVWLILFEVSSMAALNPTIDSVEVLPRARTAEVINVLAASTGVKGDGVADDTAALQSLINAAPPHSVLYFPRATYLVSTLVASNGVTFRGESMYGSKLIHQIKASDSMIKIADDNTDLIFRFEDIALDGNQARRLADDPTRLNNLTGATGALIYAPNGHKTIECEKVIFQNHLKAAITAFGSIEVRNCKFFGGAQHNNIAVPVAGFSVYIQGWPGKSGKNTLDTNVVYCTVTDSLFIADSTADADLGKNPGGIMLNEQERAGYPNDRGNSFDHNKYDRIVVSRNKFYGVSCTENANHLACLQTYNAGRSVIASDNIIYFYGLGGINLGREDNAIISHNIIVHGYEDKEGGYTQAISWSPNTREGASVFTAKNERLGEKHYLCIISDNIIDDALGSGIVTTGDFVKIHHNFVKNIKPTTGKFTQSQLGSPMRAGTLSGINANNGSYIDITENTVWNVPYVGIIAGGSGMTNELRELNIRENSVIWDENAVPTSGGSYGIGIEGKLDGSNQALQIEISGNKIFDRRPNPSTTGIQVRYATGGRVRDNYVENTAYAYRILDLTTNIAFEFNHALSNSVGILTAASTDSLLARFNEFAPSVLTPTSFKGVRRRDYLNSWNHQTFTQDNFIYQPGTQSRNSFDLLNNSGASILRVDTTANEVDALSLRINKSLKIKEGANATMGTVKLSEGRATVNTTAVTATSRIFLTCNSPAGTPGFLIVRDIKAGAYFTISSSSESDSSKVAWILIEPAE